MIHSRTLLLRTSVVAASALSLVVTGCGGRSPTTAAGTTSQTGVLAFARCMRSHGVANFPDPGSSGEVSKVQVVAALTHSSRPAAAERACHHILPSSGLGAPDTAQQRRAQLAAALSFARCIRGRGFPSFPDPTAQGELTPQMVTAAGIDLHQHGLLQAGLACTSVTHGLITRAAIDRAVNGG